MSVRKIIHVDMDAFYASVEQRDRPELRGRPVAVGGKANSRGVVAAASYEARKYGVRSAMPSSRAARLCPDLVFVSPDFARYVEASRKIRDVFNEVTDLVEPLSLDEAYLDVTSNHWNEPLAGVIARRIKQRILDDIGLVASAGVGPSKLIAKLASDHDKPDGLTIVPPDAVDAFLLPLPARRLWGVGPKTAARLEGLGIHTVADIRRASVAELERKLGSFGPYLHDLAFGRDGRVVSSHRSRKSRGAERTLARDLQHMAEIEDLVDRLSRSVAMDLTREERPGRTVVLKLRYSDFSTITRSRTLDHPTANPERVAMTALSLLALTEAGRRPVRLIGVSVGGLVGDDEAIQLELPWESGAD